jgi:heterodisulfide reductase subunit C
VEYLEVKKINKLGGDLTELIRDTAALEIGSCIQCGMCSASCPSGKRTPLIVRNLLRKVLIGQEEVFSEDDIWLCSTCYTCFERCPRNLPITDTIIFLRNLAVQKGHMHPTHLDLCSKLYNSGHCIAADDKKWNDLREYYGLDGFPPTVQSDFSELEEVQQILRSTPFKSILDIIEKRNKGKKNKGKKNKKR